MSYIRVILIFIVGAALSSCEGLFPCLEGDGNLTVESRAVVGFTGIYNSSEYDVRVVVGNETSLQVEADENLQQYIKTYVQDNSLVIEAEDNRCLESVNPIQITVSCPSLSRVVSNGSGDIDVYGFTADYFSVTLSGSGDIDISDLVITNEISITNTGSGYLTIDGKASNSINALSGSGHMNLDRFRVNNCSVNLAGSGDMRVSFINTLTGIISGSGDIHYYGPTEGVNVRTTGSGILIKE